MEKTRVSFTILIGKIHRRLRMENVDIHLRGGLINCCTLMHFHLKERHSFFMFTQLKTLPRPLLTLRSPHCDTVQRALPRFCHGSWTFRCRSRKVSFKLELQWLSFHAPLSFRPLSFASTARPVKSVDRSQRRSSARNTKTTSYVAATLRHW